MNTLTQNNRRKGNIARLPHTLRQKVNTMLDDGHTYKEIITHLEKSTFPPLPYPISEDNISNWFEGGYQDYLRAQDSREQMTIQADRYLNPAEGEPILLADGAIHAVMIQLCQLMDQAKSDQPNLKDIVAIASTLNRLSRSLVIIAGRRDQIQKIKAAEQAEQETIRAYNERVRRANQDQKDDGLAAFNDWIAKAKACASTSAAKSTNPTDEPQRS